jgi:DNA-binding HxlR family transcriptional regulator
LARTLDLLGDRWIFLVIRELALGPKRFKDLLEMLPAVGANRLSDRLKTLETSGVVQKRVLPPPAPAAVYELTARGRQLQAPLLGLARWGLELRFDERIHPATTRAELVALCMTGASPSAASNGLHEIYEFRVENETFHLSIDDGDFLVRSGPSPSQPTVAVDCDLRTFCELAYRIVTPSRALRQGRAKISSGSRSAFTRVFAIMGFESGIPVLP